MLDTAEELDYIHKAWEIDLALRWTILNVLIDVGSENLKFRNRFCTQARAEYNSHPPNIYAKFGSSSLEREDKNKFTDAKYNIFQLTYHCNSRLNYFWEKYKCLTDFVVLNKRPSAKIIS